jgi:hypothetical protein
LEPIIIVAAACEETLFGIVDVNGYIFKMNRDNMVFLVIATDFIVIICFMIFIEVLNYQQNHFSKEFA